MEQVAAPVGPRGTGPEVEHRVGPLDGVDRRIHHPHDVAADQEEVDPQDYEKKKETFSLFEDEVEKIVAQQNKGEIKEMDEWEGLEEDWEEFNKEDEKEKKKK